VKSFLENFAAILGVATLTLLGVSVSHEYGYFWHVGQQFQTFLTTGDYFANAVLWLPLTAFAVLFWLDWNLLAGRSIRIKISWKNWRTWILPAVFGANLIYVILFAADTAAVTYVLPAAYFWAVLLHYLSPFRDAQEPIGRFGHRALVTAPIVVFAVFGLGVDKIGRASCRERV